jgi:hypothetical protein
MINKTNQRKQMWADKEFVDMMERIKAKRLLEGNPVNSIPELTKEILSCQTFKNLVDELTTKNQIQINIRFDKKRIWQ